MQNVKINLVVNARICYITTTTAQSVRLVMAHLSSDELRQRAIPQLGGAALCDVEGRGDHLPGGSIHTDEVDEAGEVLQVREVLG